ncbi:MAG: sulfatase [Candidatus Hydrogenedentota bacterium]
MQQIPSRREFLCQAGVAAGLGAAAMTAGAQGASAEGKRRNMVFILIDDMRFDSMSCMGHPFLETPNLDALAAGGIMFDNAFVTTSLCSPSRASILTGQYAHNHGIFDNSTNLPDDTPTFPKELQKSGYRTGFAGKWHMGGSSDEPRPGFDHWMSFRGQGVYNDPTINVNGNQEKVEGYVTDIITDHAVDFLQQEDERPFFLYVSHKAVHADFYPMEKYKGRYADKTYPHPESMANTDENYKGKPEWVREQRNSWHGVDGMYNGRVDFDQFCLDYAETMISVDDSVGRIVNTLREQGLLDSTLLVFTSDNGFLFGEHGLIDKRCMYEPSIRVPLIAHCPELFEGGQRKKEVVANIDFAPTFLECAGAPVPEQVQGRSFMDVLTGTETGWRDALLYEYFWERSFPQTPTVLGVRTERYKFMKYHGVWDKYEIYDLQEDPHEMNNLLADFIQHNEGGQLDQYIRQNAPDDVKALFNDLDGKLNALLNETGCLAEPSWQAR